MYNIAGINKVDIKDQYTKDDKYNIMSSLHNNVLGHRGSSTMIRDLIDAGYKWDTLREDVINLFKNARPVKRYG